MPAPGRRPTRRGCRYTGFWRHQRQPAAGAYDEHPQRWGARSQYRGRAGVYDHARYGAASFAEGLRWCAEVFHALAALLKAQGLATSVGDEGGFAPDLAGDEEAITYILQAVETAGYRPGTDFVLAIDAASSEWKGGRPGEYCLPKSGVRYTSAELVAHWKALCEKFPIYSIEDGLDEEDWAGWQLMTRELGSKVQLVGDDLFVTNTERLAKGIQQGCGNAILIKLNQIGSVSETLEAIKMAHKAGYTAYRVAPLGRDGGHDHRRPRGRAEHLPDQDRRAQP